MRTKLICFLVLVFVLPVRASAQDAPDSPWQDVIPVARFGYGSLLSVYWSPITGQLAASSERGLQFYDSNLTLQAKRRFETITPSHGTIFSPNMRFAALIEDRGLIVHNTTTWEPILALDSLTVPSWSPDSAMLAVWSNSILQIWDVETATMRIEFPELVSDGAAVQWSPDGEVIAIPAGETIVMVNVRTGDIARVHDFAQIADFEWSRDGHWFIIAGLPDPLPFDHNPKHLVSYSLVKLDAVTGEIVTTYSLPQSADAVFSASNYVTISPDGRYVSAFLSWAESIEDHGWASFGMAIYDLESGQPLFRADAPASRLYFDVPYTSWSPDGSRFATSTGSSLQIYEIATGHQVADLPAYINTTRQTVWTEDATGLVAAGGLWDVTGEFPQYLHVSDVPTPPEDRYLAPYMPTCKLQDYDQCPEYMVPDPLIFDYTRPPYDWKLIQWIPDRALAISYEIDIEYPGTPEYEDEEPPEERYIIWDTNTGEKMDERVYLGLQTAWVYDIEGADYIESESRAFNIRHNTHFIAIGDDEIVDLREGTSVPLQNVNRWEWREVWFGPAGNYVYSYDTNGCFKVFEPFTGKFLYETAPASRYSIWFTVDLTLTFVQDDLGTLFIYITASGEKLLETYTANSAPLLLWNEDRSQLAIGGENRAIILYDIVTPKRLGILRGHQGGITSMAWNPTCDYTAMATCRYVLASSDSTGEVILWGTERRDTLVEAVPEAPAAPIYELPVAEVNFNELTPLWSFVTFNDDYGYPQAQTIRWTEGGIRVNGDTYYTAQLYDLEEPPEGISWVQPSDVAPDGRIVSSSGTIYDIDNDFLAEVTSWQAADAIFDPLGERVITAERSDMENELSGWIREYSAESGQFITAWGGGNPDFDEIVYSPDQHWIATTTDPYYQIGARVQVWFADRFNTQYSSLIGHTDRITALYWDGEEVITSSLDGTVRRWNIHTGWPLVRWDHPTHAGITQMNLLDDQSLLLSVDEDLIILEADTLTERRIFEGVGGGHFDWSPDKKQVTVIGNDSIIRVVDLTSGAVKAEEWQHMPAITHLEWNPNGESLAAARADGSLILLDSLSGTMLTLLRPNGPIVRSIAWSPDGSKLLLDLEDGPIQIIDSSDGTIISEIDNPWRRAGVWWSPDGTQFAYGTYPDPTINVYNAVSLLNSFNLDWADFIFYWEKKPFVLSWSPDATHIAAFYRNGVRVWNLTTGQIVNNHMNVLNLADPDRIRYPYGRPPDDPRITMIEWEHDVVYFWRPDSTWSLDIVADEVVQLSNEGLPYGTKRRADGTVVLADSAVVHADSNYSLQWLKDSYVDAAWHPTCWSKDCPAVIAVAQGSTVTIFGY